MAKEIKTNAIRFLDNCKIKYEINIYECKNFIDGVDVAEKLGQSNAETFKTLVAQGKSGDYYCFLIPVNLELDLKKAAKSVNEKSIEMLKQKDLLSLTGYIHGGCSPIGMKKFFKTVINDSAQNFPSIIFSGGKIGYQVEVTLEDLKKVIDFELCDIIV